jgi:hypothetical protein
MLNGSPLWGGDPSGQRAASRRLLRANARRHHMTWSKKPGWTLFWHA